MKFKKIILITFLLLTVLTISAVSAVEDNETIELANIENAKDNNNLLYDDSSEIISDTINNDKTLAVDGQSYQTNLNSNNEDNVLSLQDTKMIGDSGDHSYKITVKPAKVYSNKKFTYTAKLTDNEKPVSGVYLDLSIHDASNGWTSYGSRTNSNGTATFKLDSEPIGKYDIAVEIDDYNCDGYAYADSYIKVVKNPKAKTTVKAPKITAKYKKNAYFKISVKNYKGKPIKKLKLALDIKTGKKWKIYYVKTNNKGVAKFNTKKLTAGTHEVIIYDENPNSKYIIEKDSKIIIKKKITKKTTKKKSSSKYKIIKTKAKFHWITKKSGKFKVKTIIFDMTAGFRAPYKYVDTWLYKNGKLLGQSEYRVKMKINGQWTKWKKAGPGTNHHRYSVRDSASVDGIKVKVHK